MSFCNSCSVLTGSSYQQLTNKTPRTSTNRCLVCGRPVEYQSREKKDFGIPSRISWKNDKHPYFPNSSRTDYKKFKEKQ